MCFVCDVTRASRTVLDNVIVAKSGAHGFYAVDCGSGEVDVAVRVAKKKAKVLRVWC